MPPFKFKQFSVEHEQSSMKVGTDGVLLGAWADCSKAQQVLDIGTGCGLIALMIAQRTNGKANIDAIDMDEHSIEEANNNFLHSPWKNAFKAHQINLQDFHKDGTYDLIVCNPPFFINSEKPPNKQRHHARHTDSLSQEDLLVAIHRLLGSHGKLALILPPLEGELFAAKATSIGLSMNKVCRVLPHPGKDPERLLMEFSFSKTLLQREELIIELDQRHKYSKEYEALTKDFYLFF